MANLTLGLDVGARSIGWALVDEPGERIIAIGVRIFPEGVDRDQQGGEKSKSRTRRDARGMRRQLARRSKRKHRLREALTCVGLLPAEPEQINEVLSLDPYELRARALDEKLDRYELGRVFLHLNQRRGFLSNRKADKKRDDTKGMLAEMGELASAIARTGSRTLGEYLAKEQRNVQDTGGEQANQVRRRHTRRDMYEGEFDAIWSHQQEHYPDLLTEKLKYGMAGRQTYPRKPLRGGDVLERFGLHGLIFMQRSMYWPKSVIGRCELERKEKRCPRAHRSAQRFRILQEINNLRYLDRATGLEERLTQEQRITLIDYLCSAKERKFDAIRKKLRFGEGLRFNLEGPERNKLQGHETDAILGASKALGKRWKELPEETKDAAVAVLVEEEREDLAIQRLVQSCGLTHEEAIRALAVNLPDGYMNYSRLAIQKLLPHLEQGKVLMGDDASNSALHAAGYLRPDEREVNQRRYLAPSPDLPNPIVRQALVEVRKVVNGVLREPVYGDGHKLERIHIELAREAKKSFEQRQEMRFENAKRRRAREEAKQEIENKGANPTRRMINRYLLWKEQDLVCVYCGQEISQAQLFNPGEVDVDHILPRWRSLDDSLANKVVCHCTCNSGPTGKGDRTPREWLEERDPDRYAMVLRIAERLPYNKQRRFQQKDIELKDFVERQLRDTAYISRCVSQYLRCLGARVICPRGQMTAELRHCWGLNKVLNPEGDGEKTRADHRHHAVDAMVIAFTNEKRLHHLANKRAKNVDLPWQTLVEDVKHAVSRIHVSHRSQRRLHGAFHEATIYGATHKGSESASAGLKTNRPWAKAWVEAPNIYVRRKPVEELTKTQDLEKVRDVTIREILRHHLRSRGIDPDKRGTIPGDAFTGQNVPRMPRSGVPIKRVRLLEESETFRRVSERRAFQYVKPGNNHHIVYRAVASGQQEKWKAQVVTMWQAALQARQGKPLVDCVNPKDERFIMSLSIGEMFQMDRDDGEPLLCVVRKIDQRSKRVYYKLHTDAREAKELETENLYITPPNLQQRDARKVTVDPLGRMRWAKD